MVEELGERVIAGIWEENSGNLYHRRNAILDRYLDGLIRRVEIIEKQNGKPS